MTSLKALSIWASAFPNFPSRLAVQGKITELLAAEEQEIEATADTLKETFQKLTAHTWTPTRGCHCALCKKAREANI